MTESWSYLQKMIGEYEAGSCEALFVALYVVRSILAEDEIPLSELPGWLRSELSRIVGMADQGLPIQTVSNTGLKDHADMVRKFSMLLKSNGISI